MHSAARQHWCPCSVPAAADAPASLSGAPSPFIFMLPVPLPAVPPLTLPPLIAAAAQRTQQTSGMSRARPSRRPVPMLQQQPPSCAALAPALPRPAAAAAAAAVAAVARVRAGAQPLCLSRVNRHLALLLLPVKGGKRASKGGGCSHQRLARSPEQPSIKGYSQGRGLTLGACCRNAQHSTQRVARSLRAGAAHLAGPTGAVPLAYLACSSRCFSRMASQPGGRQGTRSRAARAARGRGDAQHLPRPAPTAAGRAAHWRCRAAHQH